MCSRKVTESVLSFPRADPIIKQQEDFPNRRASFHVIMSKPREQPCTRLLLIFYVHIKTISTPIPCIVFYFRIEATCRFCLKYLTIVQSFQVIPQIHHNKGISAILNIFTHSYPAFSSFHEKKNPLLSKWYSDHITLMTPPTCLQFTCPELILFVELWYPT